MPDSKSDNLALHSAVSRDQADGVRALEAKAPLKTVSSFNGIRGESYSSFALASGTGTKVLRWSCTHCGAEGLATAPHNSSANLFTVAFSNHRTVSPDCPIGSQSSREFKTKLIAAPRGGAKRKGITCLSPGEHT